MLAITTKTAWPVTATTIHAELDTLVAIATRWRDRFGSEEFCEMLDNEQDEAARVAVFVQLANELKVAASKSVALAEVLT